VVPRDSGPPVSSPGRPDPSDEVREFLRVVILVTVGLVVGALLQWVPEEPSPWRWAAFALVYVAGGIPIAKASWEGLKEGHLSVDFLMGLAAAGAAIVGDPFEGSVLLFLFSLSNLLERYAMGRTRNAIALLMDLSPQEATLADEQGREVGRIPVERLEPGQAILVRPGERIAADGTVHSGRSDVDQSAITGEAMPVTKEVGDEVFAGTINQSGALVVTATRRAGETMLARIVRLVEEAREERAPAQHFIDRFAHPYTLGVVGLTALVAILPPLFWDAAWADAFYRSMTILVVASPCALVISTPSAILSGMANGARHGVLFKGGAHLDLAGTIDAIAFDKTGTLTVGHPVLKEVVSRAELGDGVSDDGAESWRGDPVDQEGVLRVAAAVERSSEHHLARAVVRAAAERGVEVPDAGAFTAYPGEGVEAEVEGRVVWAGNAHMATRSGSRLSPVVQGWTAEQTSLGRSVVYVGSGPRLFGALSMGDTLKPTAAATIRHLKYEGIRWISLVSGDHPDAVRAIASELAVDEVKAGLLPHQKVEVIRQMVASSRGVGMVGDGVNDGPAMAAATLGIAMGAAGTDVAIETADVVLVSDEVEKVDYVIHLGRRARRVVRQNVFFSVGWMLMLVVVALTVGIPLTLAVVAHEGSTLLVVLNGLRLLGGKPHPPTVPRGRGGGREDVGDRPRELQRRAAR
jgi:Zn2+/Cd2+-exporting ATPase